MLNSETRNQTIARPSLHNTRSRINGSFLRTWTFFTRLEVGRNIAECRLSDAAPSQQLRWITFDPQCTICITAGFASSSNNFCLTIMRYSAGYLYVMSCPVIAYWTRLKTCNGTLPTILCLMGTAFDFDETWKHNTGIHRPSKETISFGSEAAMLNYVNTKCIGIF